MSLKFSRTVAHINTSPQSRTVGMRRSLEMAAMFAMMNAVDVGPDRTVAINTEPDFGPAFRTKTLANKFQATRKTKMRVQR